MNENENVFRENCGDDLHFVMILAMGIAFLTSALTCNLLTRAIEIDWIVIEILCFLIYFAITIVIILHYSIKKFEDIE